MSEKTAVDVLVVGGTAGGVSAAISAARAGATTILATEFSWLGGMLTSAGVAAPDGNELEAWHTGIWGAYLHQLQQITKLDNSWVSLFSYHPALGAEIFANWVTTVPNLTWIAESVPQKVSQRGAQITGVEFADYTVEAKIVIDATELGDLLALAELPYRWGWDEEDWQEPSLNLDSNSHLDLHQLKTKYPVQAPTWVFLLQDNGTASFPINSTEQPQFQCPWANYGSQDFLNYGKLTSELYMINWPLGGNDYGENLNRLVGTESSKQAYLKEAYEHSYSFASYLQTELGNNYGLAENIFPQSNDLHSGFALHPYYRESRRTVGITTITESDILPVGTVAPLPINSRGQVDAIAIGNYANDHHYPGIDFQLASKSTMWGGRKTGTPFTIPYGALIPQDIDGLLVCEKNISVSHIANGSTRLQPVVLNIGQAAGVAAALAVHHNCQPRDVSVREIQEALIDDAIAPAGVIPLYNLTVDHPDWAYWQKYYLDHPEEYPNDGNCPHVEPVYCSHSQGSFYGGVFQLQGEQNYMIEAIDTPVGNNQNWQLITTNPLIERKLQDWRAGTPIKCLGRLNYSGNWLLVEQIVD